LTRPEPLAIIAKTQGGQQRVRLHVHFQQGDMKVDEIVSGDTSEQVVAAMQKRVAQEAGFLVGAAVRAMSPLKFAQEVTRRYSAATGDANAPVPQTCDEFLQFGVDKKFATRLEDVA
jgi:hypothetical protein